MLLTVSKLNKTIGVKTLFDNLGFYLDEGEKIALIGKNGAGKTTLFNIIASLEKEFQGQVEYRKGSRIILTKQEHFLDEHLSAIEYILNDLPDYNDMKAKLANYEIHGDGQGVSLEEYCDAVAIFSEKGYYDIETEILISLNEFQVNEDRAKMPMKNLSGGEKRFVELVRVMYSACDLALIDEPTNHMDYIGKDKFIQWLKKTKDSLFLVSHDRDVLEHVDKILELRDRQISVYDGNYSKYLKQNTANTSSDIKSYEMALKKIKTLEEAIKTHMGSEPRLRIMRLRFQKEIDDIKANLEKPSFWIDKESLSAMSDTMLKSYEKYKDESIKITDKSQRDHKKLLFAVKKLSLGYEEPLFNNITFDIHSDDKIQIKGRNGAGKSTFLRTLIGYINEKPFPAKIFYGEIMKKNSVKLGVYEQEINPEVLDQTLGEALKNIYYELDIPFNDTVRSAVMKRYLFDPLQDYKITVRDLSGGQKARLQLIKMMANEPNLLILDEPTNHLDLPSIEELERTLNGFAGGIIYVSHDSFFVKNIGGKEVIIVFHL